jgi:hypothetical protein
MLNPTPGLHSILYPLRHPDTIATPTTPDPTDKTVSALFNRHRCILHKKTKFYEYL